MHYDREDRELGVPRRLSGACVTADDRLVCLKLEKEGTVCHNTVTEIPAKP